MGFWIFMLICDLLTPLMQIGFGMWFMKHPPEKINGIYGYRTAMSMKNMDTWKFAHHYCGKIWYKSGLAALPVILILMLFVIGKSEQEIGWLGGILCILETVLLISAVPFTETALSRKFDRNGKRI